MDNDSINAENINDRVYQHSVEQLTKPQDKRLDRFEEVTVNEVSLNVKGLFYLHYAAN